MIRMGVSGKMFLVVPDKRAVKQLCVSLYTGWPSYIKLLQPNLYFQKLQEHFGEIHFILS